jgi:hypothetical protein
MDFAHAQCDAGIFFGMTLLAPTKKVSYAHRRNYKIKNKIK